MASLTKSKTLFGFTSPRTLEKIIPEIDLLNQHFSGKIWSGNEPLQAEFFKTLSKSNFYQGSKQTSNPALAARDRITRAPKSLGFIDLSPNIQLTEIGKVLLSKKRLDETITRQLLKFQLPSHYHTQSSIIEFKVKPYLELLRIIFDLESISKTEIALFFTQLTHIDKYDSIIQQIKDFRENAKKFKGSRKLYVAKCFETVVMDIYADEFAAKSFKTRESKINSRKKFIQTKSSNMKDYADAFSRYIRSTELVTFQKKTFHLIISPQKYDEVKYILETVKREPQEFETLSAFKEFLFSPSSVSLLSDNQQLLIKKIKSLGYSKSLGEQSCEELKDLLSSIQQQIKKENISKQTKALKQPSLLPEIINIFDKIKNKEIPDAPLFLEWNVWRALVMLNYAKRIEGNFISDIDGMPINYAPGQKPDIEAEYDNFGLITEVTMSSGNTQFNMEGESVPRHFGKAKEALGKDTYCLFVAPKISEGALAHYFNLNKNHTKLYGGQTKIIPLSIEQFIEFLQAGLYYKFNNPNKLQAWLEAQWKDNQICNDEEVWSSNIASSIPKWAA